MLGRQLFARSVQAVWGAAGPAAGTLPPSSGTVLAQAAQSAAAKAYVEVSDVSLHVSGRDGKPWNVLEGVNLEIAEGEFVSVIGHSGCGKSTLLRLVSGLDVVTGGTIRVGDEIVRGPGAGRMVVFQNHCLLPWLTLRKNVALAVDHVHKSKSRAERRELVEQHLAMVHLTAAADRLPSQVSGGMKQRCGIARAFSTRPRLLLLDEPFGALDALTRAKLQDELLRLWEADRTTVMLITHDVDEALLLSDRIVLMANGPRSRVADTMTVELARPRERTAVIDQPSYYRQRGELLYFLNRCKREKAAAEGQALKKPARPRVQLAPSGLEKQELVVGFVPLLDCAPFAVAETLGLYTKHGLHVTLSREPSWKAVADGLREGRLDAAQMVAGMPLAETLGLNGRAPSATCTALTLSRGGNAITFGEALADAGVRDRPSLLRLARERKQAGAPRLIFGMTHPASMHNLLLRAWLAAGGIDPDLDLTLTMIPPPQMVANLEQGNIAAYCVGEPWNARSVRTGLGFIAATSGALWADHPEKVLAVSESWAERHPKAHVALVRALCEACAQCDDAAYRREQLPALLARPEYVGTALEDLTACLKGPYPYGNGNLELSPDHFGSKVHFGSDGGNAFMGNVCRSNEALWMLSQLARWNLVAFPAEPGLLLQRVYLHEVLREAAAGLGTKLTLPAPAPLQVLEDPPFDPAAPLAYLEALSIRREPKAEQPAPSKPTRPRVEPQASYRPLAQGAGS